MEQRIKQGRLPPPPHTHSPAPKPAQGASEAEWREAAAAAEALRDRFPDLHEELGRSRWAPTAVCVCWEGAEGPLRCQPTAAKGVGCRISGGLGLITLPLAITARQLFCCPSQTTHNSPPLAPHPPHPYTHTHHHTTTHGLPPPPFFPPSCCLVMEFVPGSGLFRSPAAFSPASLAATASALGRLFTLDMLLGNADRLRCRELSWRGNPGELVVKEGLWWAGLAGERWGRMLVWACSADDVCWSEMGEGKCTHPCRGSGGKRRPVIGNLPSAAHRHR